MTRAAIAAALMLALAACDAGTTIDEYPCPPDGTPLTYQSFGRAYLGGNCETCHARDAVDRHGAPGSITFDSLDEVHAHTARIFARAAADNVSMPPGPDDPPADQRLQLADWLACGAR